MPAVSSRRLTEGTVTEAAKIKAEIATKVNIESSLRIDSKSKLRQQPAHCSVRAHPIPRQTPGMKGG